MSIDSDQRKRRGASETLPVCQFDKFHTTPKKAKTSDDGFDNLEVDQIGKRVSKLDPTGSEDHSPEVYIQGKVFNDSIHGHVEVHPLCVKIIDTPQFQRLRNINQLGGCYYVFPGASHNRFEHSIGIGHGPFSHMFDKRFIPEARRGIPEARRGTKWKHEKASLKMFDHMVEENRLRPIFSQYHLMENDVEFIKELIVGIDRDRGGDKEWTFKGREPNKRFLYEIVANKRTEIDVDKFDYFSRDCHNLGIRNNFDHKRYMKFARVIDVNGKPEICVREKEAENLYAMFHTRRSLHQRAYQHKTSNIIEKMITEALVKADKEIKLKGTDGKMLSISESIDDMEAYTQLTDHVYHQILYSNAAELKEARAILQRIEKRDLYKCIGQKVLKEPRSKEEIREEIFHFWQDGPHITADDFIVEIVTFDYGMGDKNPMDELHFYAKNAPDVPFLLRKDEVSSMLPEKFSEQSLRVYFRRTEPDCLKEAERCFNEWWSNQQDTTSNSGVSSQNAARRQLNFTE
ncbi:PREDICTED: deoxynucleoside triphosphate triphosphohydrolase SAMHD1-like [Acropora digitifera]|uniref:deoxynucleoside triphosphate triphosphohydrolase SAMHD1-like n=1 Tax=Acropora digitifera TaxID=70779 RepID=UPI00077A7F12|nr:PREDICTED: deoxynucleoside triphosphate triphosphohydrolase SAMHD1-like [Acropora digitifera]